MHPDAAEIIDRLNMQPHPEGGYYVETWRAPSDEGHRSPSSVIYFLLPAGVFSHWHRVDADEIWHWQDGAPLSVYDSADGVDSERKIIGPVHGGGHQGHAIIPKDHWQAAKSEGDWTLVSCTVAPAFDFAGFEMAPPDWKPTRFIP